MASGMSPITSIMLSKAAENDVDNASYNEKRDALMSAYEKLMQAQQYQEMPRNINNWFGGAASLAASPYQGDRMYAAGEQAKQKAYLAQLAARQGAGQDQAKTFLEQQKAALGILNSQKDDQFKYLQAAGTSDYRDEMQRLKELMLSSKLASDDDSVSSSNSKEIAKTLGVPAYTGPDPYSGLDKVGKRQLRMGFEKKLEKEQDATGDLQAVIDRMKRFQQLNEEAKDNLIGTGPIADYVPNFSEGLQEMDTIASEMIPQMRVPGSGSTSDFDAKMFTKATVGTGKDYDVNKNVAQAYIASKENQIQKSSFMEQYLSANGHLRGAEQQWKKYLNENPIFADKNFKLNEKRKTWQDYFGASSAAPDEEKSSNGIPKGWDPEDWKHLAPDEQSMILKKRG